MIIVAVNSIHSLYHHYYDDHPLRFPSLSSFYWLHGYLNLNLTCSCFSDMSGSDYSPYSCDPYSIHRSCVNSAHYLALVIPITSSTVLIVSFY